MTNLPIENYKCEHCDKVFKLAKHFVNHKKGKKCRNDIFCKKCKQTFSCNAVLRKHLANNVCGKKVVKKSVPSHCQVCHELFDSKQKLREHIMETHPEIQMFKCEHCPLIFPTISYLNTHLRLRHNISQRDRIALQMEQNYPNATEESSVECPLCKRTYHKLTKLKDHISSSHRSS